MNCVLQEPFVAKAWIHKDEGYQSHRVSEARGG